MFAPENTPARPRPEDFPDYRAYLRTMIAYLKETRPQFSYRYFSRIAGFSSPNFLKLVADGARNLTPSSIPKFARGLGLDERERDAFETLVLLTQAETDAERNRYYARLRRAGIHASEARRLEAAQYDAYSSWYVLPIRELLLRPDFVEDPAWIARQLRPRIKPPEAKLALELLERLGLVERDPSGRLKPSDTTISTGPRVRSLAVRNYHRAMLTLAAEALDRVPIDERDASSLTVSLRRAQYEDVRTRIERFRRELLDLIDQSPPSSESEVYQLCFQLFPLTRKEEP
ncbi:MAG: TIGR02147 family protein [Deltaproteobacteria bacterium]|nr:TIGR02147 family protein [Deltaproteobacteria bacterium]